MIFLAIVVVSTASVVGGGIVVGGCDAIYARVYKRKKKNLSNFLIQKFE